MVSKLLVARSAFFLYSNDERAKVRAEHPTYGVGQVAKQLAEQWRNVSASTKAKYEKEAAEDKKRYAKVCQCTWIWDENNRGNHNNSSDQVFGHVGQYCHRTLTR